MDKQEKETEKWIKRGEKASEHFHVKELLEENTNPFDQKAEASAALQTSENLPESELKPENFNLGNENPENQKLPNVDLPEAAKNISISSTQLPIDLNPQTQDKLNQLPIQNTLQNEFGVHVDKGAYQVGHVTSPPGFVATAAHSMELLRTVGGFFTNEPDLNSLTDKTPKGWTAASNPDNFLGVPQKSISYVADAKSENDAWFRKMYALKKKEEDEEFANGSLFGKLVGNTIDTIPLMAIPMAASAKYIQFSDNLLEAILKTTPSLAVGNLLREGTIEANKIGGNIEDTLINTITDTIAGLAFEAGGVGLGHALDAGKFWDARKVLNMHYDGVVVNPAVDEAGKVIGYKAVGIDNSISAAKVDAAQLYLDATFERSGLFSIPFLGKILEGGISKVNPIFRGVTSPFETMRGFMQRVAPNSFITKGIKEGKPAPDDFETGMGVIMGGNKIYAMRMQKLLDEHNGIDSNLDSVSLVQRTIKKWTDDGYTDAETFWKYVKSTIQTETAHTSASVNEAAELTRKTLDTMWESYREVHNLPPDYLPPPTSEGYFPIVYNPTMLELHPDRWEQMWVKWWTEADNSIRTNMEPINIAKQNLDRAKELHEQLISNKNTTNDQLKQSIDTIKQLRKIHKQEKLKLADKIKRESHLYLSAADQAALTGKQSTALKKLLKPLKKQQRELKGAKGVLKKLKETHSLLELKLKETKTIEKLEPLKQQSKELKQKIDEQQNIVDEINKKLDEEQEKLQDNARDGKIDPRLFDRSQETPRVKFKDPNNLLKFRKVFATEAHMKKQAKGLSDTILNQTPEDTMNQVMGNYIGGSSERHNMKRTAMIPSHYLDMDGNNFASNNLPSIVANYRNALGRKILMKRIFGDITIDGGIEPIIERLTAEFNQKKLSIFDNKIMKQEAKEKLLLKLNKDFKNAKQDMQLTYQRMMGKPKGNETARKASRLARLWTVATRLGSVPLTMVTDLSAIIYKHGFWPTIRDGIIPALMNVKHVIHTPEGLPYIENAGHAHLAISHVLGAYNDRDWGGIAMQHVPISGKLANYMETMAHVSGNIAGTNYADNFLQRVTANIVQSKIIKYMQDFEKGILKPRDLEKMLVYGLDPKIWSAPMLEGWRSRGSDGNGLGGFQSRYWEWNNIEASNKMSETIYKATMDTIIRKGMMDAPFAFDDPIIGMMTFLHGWNCAAITRYLVPLMQRPDAEHLTGLVVMLGAGSLVSPLRKISRGEDPTDDESNMFIDALTDSGILSPIMGMVENLNILTHGELLRNHVNDRWKGRSELSALFGPIFGGAQDLTHILGMLASGQLNETDLKKAARLIPGLQPFYLKGLQNHMVESLGLPKNVSQAHNQQGF